MTKQYGHPLGEYDEPGGVYTIFAVSQCRDKSPTSPCRRGDDTKSVGDLSPVSRRRFTAAANAGNKRREGKGRGVK